MQMRKVRADRQWRSTSSTTHLLLCRQGGVILKDGLKGFTSTPIALVGTAEKASASWGVQDFRDT
jgi:hypothetical protein